MTTLNDVGLKVFVNIYIAGVSNKHCPFFIDVVCLGGFLKIAVGQAEDEATV